jgi:VWFA-related protein
MSALRMAMVLALLAVSGAAQTFRTGIAGVHVDVLVTDGDRRITDLTKEHFELRDNGVLQEIQSVLPDEGPISMMLALDTSTSVDGATLIRLKQAVDAAVTALTPTDRVALLTFANAVSVRSDWSAPSPSTFDAIARISAAGTTSLYDGLFSALTMRDAMPGRRALLVLFSDGADTSSWLPARAVLDRARRSDAVVYAVSLHPPRHESRLEYRSGVDLAGPAKPGSQPFIVEIAQLTGGNAFITARPDRLHEAFARVIDEFRSRLLLLYTPRGVDTRGWHEIEVRLKGRKGTVRARRGYNR